MGRKELLVLLQLPLDELHQTIINKNSILSKLFPGIHKLHKCTQGENDHLEGDVAIHTAMTVKNMEKVVRKRYKREADFTELLSALLHDIKKPDTRQVGPGGEVSFQQHETIAAKEIDSIAALCSLLTEEKERLHFAVKYHTMAHGFPNLAQMEKDFLSTHRCSISLALLQEADAVSCYKPGGTHSAVYWTEIIRS